MKDPKTEQFLNNGQWNWTYQPRVDFTKIDIAASEENPARLQRRLDVDRALQYGCEMEAGIDFPAIVLLNLIEPHDGFQYIVATGMHRLKGADAAHKTALDAYVITEADIYRREVLTRQANAIEGRGMTIAEQITQALWLHEQWPAQSLAVIAKEWGLKLTTVQAYHAEQKCQTRARRFAFDFERSKVSQKASIALGSIHSDVVFEKAAEFISTTAGVQTSEIKEMVAEVKKARDERLQVDIVSKYRQAAEGRIRQAKALHGRIKPTAAHRVIADARRLNNLFAKPLAELHVAAMPDRSGALLLVDDLIINLKRFRGELERAERMSTSPHVSTFGVQPGLRV